MEKPLVLLGLVFGIALKASVAFAEPRCVPPEGVKRLDYDLRWEGRKVGDVTVNFERQGTDVIARNMAAIEVGLFWADVVKIAHQSEERWRDGRFIDYRGVTTNKTHVRKLGITVEADRIIVDRSEEPVVAPLGTLPVWVWCPARFVRPKYFDLTDGKVKALLGTDMGQDEVLVGDKPLKLHRYHVKGDLEGDAWFDSRGVLVLARVPAGGGSIGTVELKPSP